MKKIFTSILTLTTVIWSLGPIAPILPIPDAHAAPGDVFLYVANGGNHTVKAMAVNQTTGVLTSLGDPIAAAANGDPRGIAATPNAKFLYVANEAADNISGYSINQTTGALTALSPATTVTNDQPGSMTVSPNGLFLYVTHGGTANNVRAFSIHQTTGALTDLGTTATAANSNPNSVAMTANGLFLYVLTSAGKKIHGFSANSTTGALTANITGSPLDVGGNEPLRLAITPNGATIYVTDGTTNTVDVFSISPTTGALSDPTFTALTTGGTVPEVMAVTPNGSFLYAGNNSSISGYSIAGNGTITAITSGTPFTATNNAAASPVAITPNGSFLITSAIPNAVASYPIAANGTLGTAGATVALGGTGPFEFAVVRIPPAPVLSGGGPGNGQSFVPTEAIIDVNADVALDSATVNTTNVTLYPCTGATDAASCASPVTTTNLCTSVALTNTTRITCTATLATNTTYRFRIGTGVLSTLGAAVAANVDRIFRTSSFGSGASSNTTPPRVQSTQPQTGAQSVPTNSPIAFFFPQGPEGNMLADMTANAVNNHANVTIQTVVNGAPTGSDLCTSTCVLPFNVDGRLLSITPNAALTASTEYEVCLSGNVQNTVNQGIGMQHCTRFRTGTGADATAPTLATTNALTPINTATSVSRFLPDLRVEFSEAMNPGSVSASTLGVYIDADASSTMNNAEAMLGASAVSVRAEPGNKIFRIGLLAPLAVSTRYCYRVTAGVTDISGNAIAATQNNCFTTGNTTDTAKPTVQFAEADNFKLLIKFSEGLLNSTVTAANLSLQCPTGVPVSLTGKTITYFPERKEAEIHGLGLPNGQTCQVTVATSVTDLNGNAIEDASSANVASFVVQSSAGGAQLGGAPMDFMSGTNFSTFGVMPQRCQPRASATGKATTLECEFPAPAALTTGAKIVLTAPSGFTVTSAATIAANVSFMNADLNGGGPGITTISNVSSDNVAGTITVTFAHSGTAMNANDMLRFELTGITTPTASGTELRFSGAVFNSSNVKQGATINFMPFTLGAAGSLSISGKVCKGATSGGSCTGGDTGINSVKVVCMQQGGFHTGGTAGVGGTASAFMGVQEATTNAQGEFTVSGLTAGQYGCNLPPQPTALADTSGGNQFQQVNLVSSNKTGLDFRFLDMSTGAGAAASKTITFSITGGPASTTIDVFCSAGGFSFENSAPVMKSLDLSAQGAGTVSLKLKANTQNNCGIGPHMAFESFGTGAPPPLPTMNFMPPRPQMVVADADKTVTFALTASNRTITGSVVDGLAAGIPNVFVHANPVGCYNATTGAVENCNGAFAQTGSDGTFTLNVSDGTYEVGADAPGLPPSTRATANVKGANVTGLSLTIAKSSTTVAGTVKDESGNGIAYAHINAERIASGGTCASFTPAGGFANAPTDENGTYTLYLGAGTWCMRAFSPAYGEVGTLTVVMASTSLTGQNISATAAEYGTLTGTITKGGTAVASAFVNCFASGTGGNHAQTSADGSFSMKVKAGTGYRCDAFAHGAGSLGQTSGITATAGGSTTVNFTAAEPGTINVTLTGITDAFCDARSSTGQGGGTANNNAGVYSLFVPAGTYTVRCNSPKTGPLGEATATVTAGATTSVTSLTVPTFRTVTGNITSAAGGANLEGATVNFTEKSTGRSFNVTSGNQSGATANLSATGVPEGTYTVKVGKKGFEPASTTATVSGGNLTLASAIALTPASGANGTNVTIPVQESGAAYTGDATVVATKDGKTVVGDIDAATGSCSLPLTNGTWTLVATSDNGKQSSSSTVTVAAGAVSGSTPTLSLANSITGFAAGSDSEPVALSTGGLLTFEDLTVASKAPELNIPSGTLDESSSETGNVSMEKDPTLATADPGADQNFVGSFGYDIDVTNASGGAVTDITGTVTVTIPYTDADVTAAGVDESKMTFASFDTTTQTWETFPTTVDTTNNTLTASITHFSDFGIIGSVSAASSGADRTAPAGPSAVTATGSTDRVTLTWTDPADSDLSRIVILRNAGGSTPISGTPFAYAVKGARTYADVNVTAGTTYKYIIRAEDTSGNVSANINEVSATVTVAQTPPAPPSTPPSSPPSTPPPATPPAAPPAQPATPATPATPAAPATDARAAKLTQILAEASRILDASIETVATAVGATRDAGAEATTDTRLVAKVVGPNVQANIRAKILAFVHYGTESTKTLGAGERLGAVNSALAFLGRLPTTALDLDDLVKISNGRFPSQTNAAREEAMAAAFARVYKRAPNRANKNDDAAIVIMAYGLRQEDGKRNTPKEVVGIRTFVSVYKKSPTTASDWDIVRAIAYSGATR